MTHTMQINIPVSEYTMQINIPASEYGDMDYFLTGPIRDWVTQNAEKWAWVGSDSWGNGYDDNGKSTKSNTYMLYNVNETDSTLFKILFPTCKVHCSGN
jgi:hypothetical protein